MMPITWLHMGAGNISRIFLGALQQNMLDAGIATGEMAMCECYDEEIISSVFVPCDNKTIAVTLHTDGNIGKRTLRSVSEAFGRDQKRLNEIISATELQLISLTITEKGYAVDPEKTCKSPAEAVTTLECVTAGLFARFTNQAPPLALVTMDNFAANGAKLAAAVLSIATAWQENGSVPTGFADYVKTQAYPWTMIDKITPHPSEAIAKTLNTMGVSQTQIITTQKGTITASFVNAEVCQYLVMEEDFPNGRPPFEQLKANGVYLTDRETVRKVDHMKVCACLNPLHTILGVSGMMLNYPTIAQCMKDSRLVTLLRKAAAEALPVVAHPGILDPKEFLEEVLTTRFPNPFIPDTPTRIATDSSQKIPVRFGQTLKARKEANLPTEELTAIPLFIALWLRYRLGKNDAGEKLTLAPDPLVPEVIAALEGTPLGTAADISGILTNEKLFGVSLTEVGLGEKVTQYFTALSTAPGAVGKVLDTV